MSDTQIYMIVGVTVGFVGIVSVLLLWLSVRSAHEMDVILAEHVRDWEHQQETIRTLENRAYELKRELALFKSKLLEASNEEPD
jgi:low affinity Fe/Cu permease